MTTMKFGPNLMAKIKKSVTLVKIRHEIQPLLINIFILNNHEMETLSELLALCEGNPSVNGEFAFKDLKGTSDADLRCFLYDSPN